MALPPRRPRRNGNTVRVQPPSGQVVRPPAGTLGGVSGRRKPTRAGTAAIEQAKRNQREADNVVPLRPGDQHREKVSNMLCRHCGCPWWIAVVTLDRDSRKPTGAITNGRDGPPIVKCHQCGREPRFD